ncbi:4-oxalocrotonate decarboxylase.XylI [Azotobacter vinelandii CA]|uniref:4-oxalocrotonate decarboxylase.XylI n=2 Tax=Azotobacter vinelandii TaxID=354 RepID=C1DMS9_AZOVD|nr:2-oxo-3-hexenedioate decarboxylase [Azotobacter vinelandii]ACO77109.1 4-oxalocrotonate decarboxylase.XylI [Azotobacter vinelandii DJ]AGK14089.1 4-oxalocrotonate decarboxylase.XylI [Azotobacter vinelandii CA]AGK18983.1 4-oxalocrotonate decarboxylase.XylI [Azotobacter vinelandii CA6]WKN22833.1 2-oxo-3-hexenedioate decarboxylase [Azotobacter vinelandii]SFX94790.1 4-oxalocrotonate decarboxylase [Azotobacter vinelandii]
MNLDPQTIERLAAHLDAAETECREVHKITDDYPDMDWEDAYAIQDALRALKEARGVRVAGLKMGLTSHAKMRQMGVIDPVYGFITDYGAVADGGEIDTRRLIHPKVEAEIAFVTKRPLSGPGCHIGSVLAATDFILPAVEIIDSRYENFRFDLKSVIADNTSSARYVLGGTNRNVEGIDLKNLGVVMEKNGEVVAMASGAAVLGHPAQSVAMLANMLGARGREIPAGTLILTGGVTEAVAVAAGDNVNVRFQHLGSVSMRFV